MLVVQLVAMRPRRLPRWAHACGPLVACMLSIASVLCQAVLLGLGMCVLPDGNPGLLVVCMAVVFQLCAYSHDFPCRSGWLVQEI